MTIEEFIRENPGRTSTGIARANDLMTDVARSLLNDLVVSGKVVPVGGRYFWTEDFPNIAPNSGQILRWIKAYPEGISLASLREKTQLPDTVIQENTKFLLDMKEISLSEGRFKPVRITDSDITLSVMERFDLLSREELIALCKAMYVAWELLDSSLKPLKDIMFNREAAITTAMDVIKRESNPDRIPQTGRINFDLK